MVHVCFSVVHVWLCRFLITYGVGHGGVHGVVCVMVCVWCCPGFDAGLPHGWLMWVFMCVVGMIHMCIRVGCRFGAGLVQFMYVYGFVRVCWY